MYKLLKILRRELFINQTSLPRLPLCHALWNFGNSKYCFFQNERRHKAGNFYKDLLFGHLQPGVHKNSEGLAILILEFDDVMVKTLYKRGFWDCICATHICLALRSLLTPYFDALNHVVIRLLFHKTIWMIISFKSFIHTPARLYV